MREGHAGVAVSEVRHLLPPAQVIAAEAVREDEHRAATFDFVIETAIAPVEVTSFHGMVLRGEQARGGYSAARRANVETA